MQEVYFPRGGTKPKPIPVRSKQKNLFDVDNIPKKKKRKADKPDAPSERQTGPLHLNSVDILAYNKIQPSAIILGCVKEILAVTIKVQLPGTLYAEVQVNAISDKLTDKLVTNADFYREFNLKSVFEIGDFGPVQILENGETADGNKRLIATTNPANVNSRNNCNSFREGRLVWGAISERSDHVYSVDLGVANVRCILNIKDVADGLEYVEGKPLWLLIKKVQTINNVTTIIVTSLEKDFENYTTPVCNLDLLMPGSCVEVTCTKVLKNGLQLEFFNNCTGYLNKIYLNPSQRNLSNYLEKSFKAYVLYENPITKFVYFTSNNPHEILSSEYEIGTVVNSTIVDDFPKGVLIKLENSEIGFVTYKRLIRSLNAKDNSDVQDLIKQKFCRGSKRKCRIMDFSYMDRMYVCTFETNVVEERYFKRSDLSAGEIVTGKIKNINKSGLLISVGMVDCFVNNEHLTNVEFSENFKLKYKIGKKVKARVLSVESTSVKLTLKPALLENHECLTSYDQAKVSRNYLGVVVNIRPHMVIVKFYNEVKGIILDKEKANDYTNLFYQGQVISVTVASKHKEKMVLSFGENKLEETNGTDSKSFIGKIYNNTVIKKIKPDELVIKTKDLKGVIPLSQLCTDLKLSKQIKDCFKTNQKLSKVMCLKTNSRNDAIFSLHEESFVTLNELKRGTIVRGFVNSFDKDILNLHVPTKEGVVDVIVDKKDIEDQISFEFYQSLFVKITSTTDDNMIFKGTIKFSEIFTGDFEYPAKYLEKHLNEIKNLQDLSIVSNPISKYKIGQKVNARITKIKNNFGCRSELSDGTIGIAANNHMTKDLKINSEYTGIVLFVNLTDNVLELSFIPQIVKRKYKKDIELKKGDEVYARVMLIRNNFAVCEIRHEGHISIGFCPIKLNENDFSPNHMYFKAINGKFRFRIFEISDFGVVGFPSDFLKNWTKIQSRKRKNSASEKPKPKRKKSIENERLEVKEHHSYKNNDDSGEDMNSGGNFSEKMDLNNDGYVQKNKKSDSVILKPPTPVSKKFQNPSMSNFFENSTAEENEDDNSEDESDTDVNDTPKKRKLTKSEQVELLKREEEELRKIELTYADMNSDSVPQTADQFDRRLLAEPNTSALWIQYAALHISNTEIDKARAVFRKALQTVNPTLTEELLNVWTAYMNLEHSYGTKQSFNDVFMDAVKYNDDLRVYIHAVNTLSTSQNIHDVDEMIEKMVKKFKQEPKMYVEVAKIYYKQNRFAEARKLRSKGLATISEKKKHIPLIIQFAKLEFDNNQDEYAETLFETILKDAPQRVDVWIVYVDQLIKKNKIDLARRVLQRAVGQKLKISKMTSLCKKYVTFEKQYGDEETRGKAEGILNEVFSSAKSKN